MFCGPHKGVLHNTMTNIWVLFFTSKIFHKEIAEKPKKKAFVTMSDIPFLTGIHVTSFRNGHIHKQNPASDMHFACESRGKQSLWSGCRMLLPPSAAVRA